MACYEMYRPQTDSPKDLCDGFLWTGLPSAHLFPYKLTEHTNWPPRQTFVTFNDSQNKEIPCAFSCTTKSRISSLAVEQSYEHISLKVQT